MTEYYIEDRVRSEPMTSSHVKTASSTAYLKRQLLANEMVSWGDSIHSFDSFEYFFYEELNYDVFAGYYFMPSLECRTRVF